MVLLLLLPCLELLLVRYYTPHTTIMGIHSFNLLFRPVSNILKEAHQFDTLPSHPAVLCWLNSERTLLSLLLDGNLTGKQLLPLDLPVEVSMTLLLPLVPSLMEAEATPTQTVSIANGSFNLLVLTLLNSASMHSRPTIQQTKLPSMMVPQQLLL